MVNESAFIGTELKFNVNIQSSGFSMLDDDFRIILQCGSKEIVFEKADCIIDEDQNFFIVIDTSLLKRGDVYAITYAYVPDEDCPDGIRTEVDKQLLFTIKKL